MAVRQPEHPEGAVKAGVNSGRPLWSGGPPHTGARERLQAGIEAARRQQTPLVRPPALSDEEQDEVPRAIAAGEHSCSSAARMFGVSPATISRLVRRARDGGT